MVIALATAARVSFADQALRRLRNSSESLSRLKTSQALVGIWRLSVAKLFYNLQANLAKVLGPIDGADLKKPPKPLCENIFDVQRSELFEVLEMLRKSFWNDDVVEETQSLQQPQFVSSTEEPPLSPTKRIRESDDDMSENEGRPMVSKKRARLTNTPQGMNFAFENGLFNAIADLTKL
ncbi:hypothetical protein [Parasitella parasitica]|uniref:Uncharacterized protein n=1 Tax=Parasitella parasitica TaxID=35722 RepID=A0A0B7MV93_9FUNG|nr:hypothetical protein [Parasitella parasitica]